MIRGRRDHNHGDIVTALERAGVKVRDLSEAGKGMSDLLTFYKGELKLIEIKNLDGRGRRYTPMQEKFRAVWPVFTVTSAREALEAHGIEMEVSGE